MFPKAVDTIDEFEPTVELKRTPDLSKRRTEFRAAVDKNMEWRDEAREDYEFYRGLQWNKETERALMEQGRPVITDNRIKPLINLVSGYQRLNRYEPEFLPRTNKDNDLCSVRKGLTKYIFDQCDYGTEESRMFLDGAIGGRAWLEVSYDIDYASLEGEAKIKRVSPSDIYPDPESRDPDYIDARYLCRCKWTDKDELKAIYPDKAEYIDAMVNEYDKDELRDYIGTEPLWYQRDTHKIRLIEHWRKETVSQQYYLLRDGTILPKEKITTEHIIIGVKRPVTMPMQKVVVCVFVGEVELEEKDSPYEHGEFPFVPYTVCYLGEDDIPAGVVRDAKDLQREHNKRRSQSMNILNTQLNGGVMYEQGAMDDGQLSKLKLFGTVPGVALELQTGGLNKIKFITPQPPPVGELQSMQETAQSIKEVTGINESLYGGEGIPSSASGKAIELRQSAARTQIGGMFDNLRRTKLGVVMRLWGRKGRKGIVQQYYTEEKTFRVISDNGQQDFVTINQQVPGNDEMGNAVWQTLNDITASDFDVVISESPATATQRIANMTYMVDAMSKLGIPGELVFDLVLDMSDIPNKEEIKKRWLERQEQAKQASGQQEQRPPTISIPFRDLPPNGQVQAAAKAGIQLDPQQMAQRQSVLMQILAQIPPDALLQLAQMEPQQFAGNDRTGIPIVAARDHAADSGRTATDTT